MSTFGGTVVGHSSTIRDRVYINPCEEFRRVYPGAEIADAHLRTRRPSIENGARAMGWVAHERDGARDRLPVGTAILFEPDPLDITVTGTVHLSPTDVHPHRIPSSAWECHMCTLVNQSSFLNCEACFTSRSRDATPGPVASSVAREPSASSSLSSAQDSSGWHTVQHESPGAQASDEMSGMLAIRSTAVPSHASDSEHTASTVPCLGSGPEQAYASEADDAGQWEASEDEVYNRTFYYNRRTGHSQWTQPARFTPASMPTGEEPTSSAGVAGAGLVVAVRDGVKQATTSLADAEVGAGVGAGVGGPNLMFAGRGGQPEPIWRICGTI